MINDHQTKQKVLSPDNRHISLGEELPCHLNELEEDGAPALKISWGPPTANLWPDWSPQKRVNRDKLDQR